MLLVSVSAFPKSGVTYLSSLLFFALFDGLDPTEIEKKYVIDVHTNDLSRVCTFNNYAFYKNHYPYDLSNEYCTSAKKVIYLVRDPIDIMRSVFDYRSLIGDTSLSVTLDTFARNWIESQGNYFEVAGPWPQHVKSWMEQADRAVHLVRYNDLVDSPAEQLASIFTFLEIDLPQSSIDRAVLNSTMEEMRAREEAEFSAKRPGVFYSEGVARGMAEGARFVNKGYRASYDELGTVEKLMADKQFGAVRSHYLPEAGGERVFRSRVVRWS